MKKQSLWIGPPVQVRDMPFTYRLIDTYGGEIGMTDSERPLGMGDTVRLPDGSNGEVLEVYDDEDGREGGVAATLVIDEQ